MKIYNRCGSCKRFCKTHQSQELAYKLYEREYFYIKSNCCDAHICMRRPKLSSILLQPIKLPKIDWKNYTLNDNPNSISRQNNFR